MTQPHSKAEILQHLQTIRDGVSDTLSALSLEQMNAGTAESWSAANYLKHLILSIKPFAKAMKFPPAQLEKLFGLAERPSGSYAELGAKYQARLADGIRAEDYAPVTPFEYRYPEGMTDEKAYLLETWQESNNRLLTILEQWSEEDLDRHQIPHPAVGLITVREMFFFTIYHNTLHWRDMQQAVQQHAL